MEPDMQQVWHEETFMYVRTENAQISLRMRRLIVAFAVRLQKFLIL